MATDKNKKTEPNTVSNDSLEEQTPVSERDEVKQAEERTRNLQEKAKEFTEGKDKDQ